ncbi:zinc finger, CCHC-type containing protein [Tanacetum coccineum]
MLRVGKTVHFKRDSRRGKKNNANAVGSERAIAWWIDSGATNSVANGSFKRKRKLMETIEQSQARLPNHNLVIHQMDVKTAFLNGDLDKEVYMKQPEGFVMLILNERYGRSGTLFLGIKKIKRENQGLSLLHPHYIEKILKKFNREDCSPTRPDIAYVVGRLSRFTSNLSRQHWKAITRVFKYLRGTKEIIHLLASGGCSCFGSAISWLSKSKQSITSSTMEFEFVALLYCCRKEAEWLRNLIVMRFPIGRN